MKDLKLYNVIFPIWFLLFFPPVILITLVGNFLIDSLVLVACFKFFEFPESQTRKDFYKNSIIKVWLFGFLADFMGAALLFSMLAFEDTLGIPNELINAISYDPFASPLAVLIILLVMLVAGLLIFFFNYRFTFKKLIADKKLKLKVALTIAIVTIPWTFLLPTKWFYY